MGIKKFELPKGWNEHINKKNADLSLTAAAKFNLDQAVSSISYPFLVMTGDHDPNLTSSKDIVVNPLLVILRFSMMWDMDQYFNDLT